MTNLRRLLSAVLLTLATTAAMAQNYDSQRAKEAFHADDYATVIKILEPAYEKGQTDAYDNITLGYVLNLAGQYERSIGPLNKAMSQIKRGDDSSREFIIPTRACNNIYLGNREEALADINAMKYTGKRPANDYVFKARFLYTLGDEAEALNVIDYALGIMPDSAALYIAKSRFLTDLGRGAEAASFLNTAIEEGHLLACDELSGEIAKAYIACGQYSKALPLAISAWNEDALLELYDTIPSRVEWQFKAMGRNATDQEDLLTIRGDIGSRYGDFDACIANYKELRRTYYTKANGTLEYAYMMAHKPADVQAYVDMMACADSTAPGAKIYQLTIWAEQGEKAKLKEGIAKIFGTEDLSSYATTLCRSLIRLNDKAEAEARIPALREVAELRLNEVVETVCFANLLEQFGHHDEAAQRARKAIRQVEVGNRMRCDKLSNHAWATLAYAIADPSNPKADAMANALASRKAATANDLFASACLRSCQGRTDEALVLLDRAMKMGALVSEAHGISLLSGVRKLAGFEKVMKPYDQMVAVRTRSTETKLMTVKYDDVRGDKRIGVSMNGLDVKASVRTLSHPYICLSGNEALFMLKNGYASDGDYLSEYGLLLIKKLVIGDVELRNQWVFVDTEQTESVFIPRQLLISALGTMTEDKAAKTMTFDISL